MLVKNNPNEISMARSSNLFESFTQPPILFLPFPHIPVMTVQLLNWPRPQPFGLGFGIVSSFAFAIVFVVVFVAQ